MAAVCLKCSLHWWEYFFFSPYKYSYDILPKIIRSTVCDRFAQAKQKTNVLRRKPKSLHDRPASTLVCQHGSRHAIALALGKLPPFHHLGLSVQSMLCAGSTGTSPHPKQGIRRQLSGERECLSLETPAPPGLESTDTGQLIARLSIDPRRSKLKTRISFATPCSQDFKETDQPVLRRLYEVPFSLKDSWDYTAAAAERLG